MQKGREVRGKKIVEVGGAQKFVIFVVSPKWKSSVCEKFEVRRQELRVNS